MSKEELHIIIGREIILKADNNLTDISDYTVFNNPDNEPFYFEEKTTGIKALVLKHLEPVPEGYKKILLREYFANHTSEQNFLAFRAKALYEWKIDNKFCSTCGNPLNNHESLTAMECPACGKIVFPRISPCIIVTVQKDNKILLAKHTYRNQDMYACIAGFMEAGESVEEAVEREVFEETGLKIKNIIYRGSQSWPFPDQLMLGFTAEYAGGELKLQKEEIADAQWFDPDNCPASPKPGSIAYKLIHKLY